MVDPAAWLDDVSLGSAFAAIVVAFTGLYFGFAGLGLVLRGYLLPAMGIGHVLSEQAPRPGQVRREVIASLVTIFVFGIQGVGQLLLWRTDMIAIVWEASAMVITGDLVLVFVWNELHFYVCHRALHTRWLLRHVHRVHHASVVPTPFSTYSFHWIEAALLGSVMLTAMLWHDFHVLALLALPVISIAGNMLGHLDYDPFPGAHERRFVAMARRHQQHHARSKGNYGFLLSWLDRWLGTELLDPAKSSNSDTASRVST